MWCHRENNLPSLTEWKTVNNPVERDLHGGWWKGYSGGYDLTLAQGKSFGITSVLVGLFITKHQDRPFTFQASCQSEPISLSVTDLADSYSRIWGVDPSHLVSHEGIVISGHHFLLLFSTQEEDAGLFSYHPLVRYMLKMKWNSWNTQDNYLTLRNIKILLHFLTILDLLPSDLLANYIMLVYVSRFQFQSESGMNVPEPLADKATFCVTYFEMLTFCITLRMLEN